MSNAHNLTRAVSAQYRTNRNLDARIQLHRAFSTNPYGWFPWYLDQLDLPAGSSILEVGSGPSALWEAALQRELPAWRLTVSDFSFGMVRASRENTAGCLRYANLDAQAIPFPNAVFDAVLANHMLYHVPDLPRAVAEVRRVLKPGGRMFAATNGATNMTDLDTLVERLAPNFAPQNNPQIDRWRGAFTLENGPDILKQSFDHVHVVRYPDNLVIPSSRPIVDYVLSMQANFERAASDEEIAAFQAALDAELRSCGSIFIHKDVGVLIAW